MCCLPIWWDREDGWANWGAGEPGPVEFHYEIAISARHTSIMHILPCLRTVCVCAGAIKMYSITKSQRHTLER